MCCNCSITNEAVFYPYKLKQLKINIKENLQFDVKHIVLNTMKK